MIFSVAPEMVPMTARLFLSLVMPETVRMPEELRDFSAWRMEPDSVPRMVELPTMMIEPEMEAFLLMTRVLPEMVPAISSLALGDVVPMPREPWM